MKQNKIVFQTAFSSEHSLKNSDLGNRRFWPIKHPKGTKPLPPKPRCKCGHRRNTHFRSQFKCNWAGLNPSDEFGLRTTVEDIRVCACKEYRPRGQKPPREMI